MVLIHVGYLLLVQGARGCLAEQSCRPRGWRFYSTVTDFARLRGWSTSVPMKTAA